MNNEALFHNDLYSLNIISKDDKHINAEVSLNSSHSIFNGHFPDNPVLPGVCTIQIIKEIIENSMELQLFLREADNVKYLSFIDPRRNVSVNFSIECTSIEANVISCKAKVFKGEVIFCNFRGKFYTATVV